MTELNWHFVKDGQNETSLLAVYYIQLLYFRISQVIKVVIIKFVSKLYQKKKEGKKRPRHILWENHNSKRYMYPKVHCSTIHNSQDTETTYKSIDRWMDKEVVVYKYNGLLLGHKKERIWASSSEEDEPRACLQTEVNHKEKNKYHMLMHIYGI